MAAGAVMAGIAIVGGGINMYANYKEGQAQERAAQAKAAANRRQAQETLRRTELDLVDIERETNSFMSDQMLQVASNSVSLSSGVAYDVVADTIRKRNEMQARRLEEGRWEAREIELGALDFERQGGELKQAADFKNIGEGIDLFGSLYGMTQSKGVN